ncbi:MAG: DEAD/DEAH box helicase [Polyangiaceae bacterium]
MPAYRFSWDAFDDRTVTALAVHVGYDPARDQTQARAFLEQRVKRPNSEFVGEVRDLLVNTWLPSYRGLDALVERLIEEGLGPNHRPRTPSGRLDYLRSTRKSKRFRQFLLEAMLRFGDQDRVGPDEGIGDFVRRFASVQPASQARDPREPHPYQTEAWERLGAHLAEAERGGVFRGILVMPTGSGKTYTAVRWLVANVIARGGRVLWLAHRTELLNQAASEFHRLSAFAAGRERLRIRIVSGDHCGATQIDPSDDIVVASIASLARAHEVVDALVRDPQLFVVIDEAHHAPSRSYRNLLAQLEARKRFRLLGLTATPTRTRESERGLLHELFGGRVIHQVDVRTLIERRILARPIPVHVPTNAEVESGVTREDLEHLGTFNDLSEGWLDRIAHMEGRNAVILQHYLAHRARYGQTLIFAINVPHAALLTEALRAQGVNADYVASYRPDGSEGEPEDVIRRFRDKQIQVLVNVQMVTEGVDVPSIQTVFLARPSSSEILVRQMIGRALRGPATAGGTKEAFIVSFEDHWAQFRDWASPLDLVPDVVGIAPEEEGAPTPAPTLAEHLPWELIRAVATRLREQSIAYKADAFEAVPHGWYLLEREDEDVSLSEPIAVYEHQRPCWEAFLASAAARAREAVNASSAEQDFEEFFGDCDVPAPATHDVDLVLRHFALGGARPDWTAYEDRRLSDPYEIADEVMRLELSERPKTELLNARYGSLAKAIYPSMREFRAAVEDALYEKQNPGDSTRHALAVPIFAPRPDEQMRPGPAHDLAQLMTDALRIGSEILGVPLAYSGELLWTRRLVKGWYGMAWYEHATPTGHGRIRINRLMDSPDTSADTMRFLLWHEYLHLFLKAGHTKTFRDLEKKWPNWVVCDREMDSLNERFGVQYW